jgi:hypothetical protein
LHTQKLEDAPASVTIITQEDIRKCGYRTLAEALSDAWFLHHPRSHLSFSGVRGFALPGDYKLACETDVEHRDPLSLNGRVDTLSVPGRSVFVVLNWRIGNQISSLPESSARFSNHHPSCADQLFL